MFIVITQTADSISWVGIFTSVSQAKQFISLDIEFGKYSSTTHVDDKYISEINESLKDWKDITENWGVEPIIKELFYNYETKESIEYYIYETHKWTTKEFDNFVKEQRKQIKMYKDK